MLYFCIALGVKSKKEMVKYQRKNLYSLYKRSKDCVFNEDEESCLTPIHGTSAFTNLKAKPKLLYIILLSLISFSLVLATQYFSFDSLLYSFGFDKGTIGYETACSSVPNGTLCCDRSSMRSDICVMKGDVRTQFTSSSVVLYSNNGLSDDHTAFIQHESIRPYTRKWETNVMETINELSIVVKRGDTIGVDHKCDVQHQVPAVFFSTGGYTGNLYHEFNDGILPLYITSQHFNKKVIFVILEYHDWWIMKYGDILSQLSDYPAIDFNGDKRVHCFPESIVGLRIHDELTVDSSMMEDNKTVVDFHNLLDRSYWPRISSLIQDEEKEKLAISPSSSNLVVMMKRNSVKPKLVIVSRSGSRAITNEESLVKLAEGIGFQVEVLKPERTTELAKIYRVLNSSDVMIGVHGAAMTHFLFTKPGSVFIQVIPLGTDWAAETYYGEPSRKLGSKYIGYKILPKESSLYADYKKDDPVLIDPDSVNAKGWEFTKKIYLDRQNVKLNLPRFKKRLLLAYYYTIAQKNGHKRGHISAFS